MSFINWRNFKTNKRVILFCKKLESKSMNLNQRKSRNLLEVGRHFKFSTYKYELIIFVNLLF